MFRALVEKEIREIIGSTKFAVSFGICATLIVLTFAAGALTYRTEREYYEAAETASAQQFQELSDWSSVRDHHVFLPPNPLATLVGGISDDIGRTLKVTRYGMSTLYGSRYEDEPALAVFRFLDLEFLFGTVLSLLAILLCYDAVSGEKERGMLRMVFANSVSRHTYLTAKLVGALIAVGVPLVTAILVGSLIFRIIGVPLTGEEWIRLVLITLGGITYVSCFLVFSLLVSTLTWRSSHSLLILLAAWVIAVQLFPRASVLLAERAVDVPTVDETAAETAEFSAQVYREYQDKMMRFRPSKSSDGTGGSGGAARYMDSTLMYVSSRVEALALRLAEDRQNRERSRARLGLGLARISPTASFALAATALAGTDLELVNQFRRQAELYRRRFGSFIQEKINAERREAKRGGKAEGTAATVGGFAPSEVPVFQFEPARLSDSLTTAIPDLGLLLVYLLVAFAASLAAFARYDLR